MMGGFSLDEGYAEWVAEQAKVEEAERKRHLVVMDDAWWKAMTDKAKGGTLRG